VIRLAFLAALASFAAMPSASATFTPMTWGDLTSRPRPAPQTTLTYGPDEYQKVDLWLPAGQGPFPVVLMVHGGCWTTSIADRSLMNWAAEDLRRAGYAVWNIDYRGVDRPGGGYPGTFSDTAAAADLLRDNAAKYRLDLSRVVAVGHSAGGHLALWLAARPRLPADSPLRTPDPLPVAHVISLGGLPDLEQTAASPDNGCGTDVVARLVGQPSAGRSDVYRDTSVPRLFPLGVPQDLVNGREDSIIPYRLATDYVAKAKGEATLHAVADTGHVELIAPGSAAWTETKRLIARAFRR
jgi:acetyl esterase/lipase